MVFEKMSVSNGKEFKEVKKIETAWLWTFIFGIFYPLYKGAWMNALAGFILGILTAGLSWIIYPFFAGKAIGAELEHQGWTRIG